MIRTALVTFLIVAVVVAALALQGDAGQVLFVWRATEIRMTAVTAILLVLGVSLFAAMLWRIIMWLVDAPKRAARHRAEVRRRQGLEAIARGFIAAAAGDGADARRLAQRAANLAEDSPLLVRVLQAQAAEAAGDAAAARGAYSAMLGVPDLRLVGHRGLMQLAIAEGDGPEALRHAEAAFGLARTARWAWRALLEARLGQGDWAAALDLVKAAGERKILPPVAAERARAALLAASAAGMEASPEAKDRAHALSEAQSAVKLRPDFAPGAVMAARLLAAEGKEQRAAQVIEQAWRAQPHPALWLAYRDLVTAETPPERADRLARLANLNAHARESRILAVELALISGDPGAAQTAMAALQAEPVTQRLAGLFARVAQGAGKTDEARAWIARAAALPGEPDWSDLDPEGRAFNYTPADWARIVSTYAETGELVHPRFERAERSLGDLPQLPSAYGQAPALAAAAAAAALPDLHDAGYEEDYAAPSAPFPVPPPEAHAPALAAAPPLAEPAEQTPEDADGTYGQAVLAGAEIGADAGANAGRESPASGAPLGKPERAR